MKKRGFYTELAYLFGIIALALGVTFMERANFGMSMVVAPAYVLHRYISLLPGMGWFTFGVAEYTLQLALVIALMLIMRKFRVSYLFSFVTAVWYGYLLDLIMWLIPPLSEDAWGLRIVFFIAGELFCTLGVSLVFHTYIPPEAYELFVSELDKKTGKPVYEHRADGQQLHRLAHRIGRRSRNVRHHSEVLTCHGVYQTRLASIAHAEKPDVHALARRRFVQPRHSSTSSTRI